MIIDRANLGPLPSKFTRLEQWDPDDWVQEPPEFIHCATIAGGAEVTFYKGASWGRNCSINTVLWTDTWTYSKAAKPVISWPEPYEDPDDNPGFNEELATRIEEFDEFYESAPGGGGEVVTRTNANVPTGDRQITSNDLTEDACSSVITPANPGYFDFWSHSPGESTAVGSDTVGFQPFFSSPLYVNYTVASYERTYTVLPAPAAPMPDLGDAGVGSFQVTGYGATAPDSVLPTTTWPPPVLTGSYYRENTRERLEWTWEIIADNIYSEAAWPKDKDGAYVTLTGALRWKITTTRSPDSGPEEETVEYFSESFTLDQGVNWEGSPQSLDESGELGVTVTRIPAITNVIVRYPSAAMENPNYSDFPYVPTP